MAGTPEQTEKQKFIDKLANFINRNRKSFLIGALVLVVFLAGLIVYVEVRKSKIEASTARIEAVEREFSEWLGLSEEDSAKKSSVEENITREAESILARYGNTPAGERALNLLAGISFEKKDFDKAASLWTDLAGKYSKSYFAPMALMNAAAAFEEAGKPDSSIEVLTRIADSYGNNFPEMPRVLFSLGRISEMKESFDAAKNHYDRLIDEYPGSSWTKLARNRIIFLEAGKKI